MEDSKDLISRQATIEALDVGAEVLRRVLDDADVVGVERAKYEWGLSLIESHIADVKDLPSAEPEIIRCKDCENWKPQIEAENRGLGICSFHNAKYVTSEGYCYWTERRTDD